jgi:hypothetical protein
MLLCIIPIKPSAAALERLEAPPLGRALQAASNEAFLCDSQRSRVCPMPVLNRGDTRVKGILARSAEKMPEENYSFKPVDTAVNYRLLTFLLTSLGACGGAAGCSLLGGTMFIMRL